MTNNNVFNVNTLPNTTPVSNVATEKAAVKAKIISIVASMQAIELENEHIKELIKNLKKDHGIAPKESRRVARALHGGDVNELEEEITRLETLLDLVR